MSNKNVMICKFRRPYASMRMFCFPWAGGGTLPYVGWGADITDEVEVYALCLPGREERQEEPCRHSMQETLDEITDTIHTQYWDKPFVFYGHSFGAYLAFFAAMRLNRLYNRGPDHMFLSGAVAPNVRIKAAVTVPCLVFIMFVACSSKSSSNWSSSSNSTSSNSIAIKGKSNSSSANPDNY
ncbi:S-acyl fatty acid synthase thioesterase, medium chain [Aplysia californica]|uniref:oleoyl-[acyl-carrier-protein] hydrolase n=1 Tax=Aplysia californica TaxID=6500 RepID=A0ABM1A5H6_APLCA|nr:S-acyl fatty acid synthase thioesterase, medium chain [Aplysia californica]